MALIDSNFWMIFREPPIAAHMRAVFPSLFVANESEPDSKRAAQRGKPDRQASMRAVFSPMSRTLMSARRANHRISLRRPFSAARKRLWPQLIRQLFVVSERDSGRFGPGRDPALAFLSRTALTAGASCRANPDGSRRFSR